jgi:hypothetical protein
MEIFQLIEFSCHCSVVTQKPVESIQSHAKKEKIGGEQKRRKINHVWRFLLHSAEPETVFNHLEYFS